VSRLEAASLFFLRVSAAFAGSFDRIFFYRIVNKKKLLCRKHPWIAFTGRTGIRFWDQNRIAIDPDWFLIAIMIAIAVSKSGSDCEMKIADRFSHENRDPISRSVCTCGLKTGFQSRSDLQMKIADRFYRENRDPIAKCGYRNTR